MELCQSGLSGMILLLHVALAGVTYAAVFTGCPSRVPNMASPLPAFLSVATGLIQSPRLDFLQQR